MKKWQQFLQDGSGVFSSTRLAFLLWVVGTLVVWIFGCIEVINAHATLDMAGKIKAIQFPVIPENVMLIIGALMTGKVWQSFSENSADKSTTSLTVQQTSSAQQGTSENVASETVAK
uniref:Uncharacterized protein n=1 Tax=Chlorobium chlorochromatii (strain CaD3) TaxID=340177 RepID=Q3AP51_CHLCH